MITVLIVEDSQTVREHLRYILAAVPDIQVIGTAADGMEAVEFVQRQTPNVIVMDINMPRMDGFQATRSIMETRPVPIILVSANCDPKEMTTSFKAMEAGAVAVLAKPRGLGYPDAQLEHELIQHVKLMSEVKVVRRWRKPAGSPLTPTPARIAPYPPPAEPIKLVAIGTSTGGPPVLYTMLSRLSKDFPAAIMIVQHIAKGFLPGLAQWLEQTTGFPVHIGTRGERLIGGHVYFGPDDVHIGVTRDGRIVLTSTEPDNGLRPSAAHLFRSVTQAYGKRAVGVLLTGMGADGASELKMMRDAGAITIAQDKASSLIYGMPGEAIKLGAATYILAPEEIVIALEKLVKIQ